jgi:hypothetical protein
MNASCNVYGKDRTKCTGLFDVHKMASLFRERGVTQQTKSFLTHG